MKKFTMLACTLVLGLLTSIQNTAIADDMHEQYNHRSSNGLGLLSTQTVVNQIQYADINPEYPLYRQGKSGSQIMTAGNGYDYNNDYHNNHNRNYQNSLNNLDANIHQRMIALNGGGNLNDNDGLALFINYNHSNISGNINNVNQRHLNNHARNHMRQNYKHYKKNYRKYQDNNYNNNYNNNYGYNY